MLLFTHMMYNLYDIIDNGHLQAMWNRPSWWFIYEVNIKLSTLERLFSFR